MHRDNAKEHSIPTPSDALLSVLEDATLLISSGYNDFSWSSWDNSAEALVEVEVLIAALKDGQTISCSTVTLIFSATGPMQQVAISSGWIKQFMNIAKRADIAIAAYG